jgi:hypothetical protein
LPGQVVRLVEPAGEPSSWVQRHGHHGVGAVEHLGAREPHHAAKRFRQQPAVPVLEGVNHVAQRAVVPAGAPGERKLRRVAQATRAFGITGLPGGQLVATPNAPRRHQAADALPAPLADRARQGPVEHGVAGHALWLQRGSDQGVADGGPHGHPRCKLAARTCGTCRTDV